MFIPRSSTTDRLTTVPTTYANRKARLGLTSIANRPHANTREINRRLDQECRDITNRNLRGGLSRRGRPL